MELPSLEKTVFNREFPRSNFHISIPISSILSIPISFDTNINIKNLNKQINASLVH